MKALVLQPPVAQLNTAYPSGAYLSAFFRTQSIETAWLDLNIELFCEIFSRAGLEKLFSLCSGTALKKADDAEKRGDGETAFNLRRYVAQKNLWCEWIGRITSILRPDAAHSGFEEAHRFVFGPHVPRGARMEQYLSRLDHDLSTDDARSLASLALADLADFISAAFDEHFSLVRYAESLTVSERTFSDVEKGADSPVLRFFFAPLLERLFPRPSITEKTLVLISVPFAGTFAAALCAGRHFKRTFGSGVFVALGGGFVNTELRDCREPALSSYCDALCFDRGYASYKALLSRCGNEREPVFKLRQFAGGEIIEPLSSDSPAHKEAEAYERKITSSLAPDFSDIDFSRYPRLIDDTNPMHRLWSDGAWLKAYMAHGCYWHKCAFCDVTLDYVSGYCPTDVKKLYARLLAQCEEKGALAIHFVDEAMPPALMVAFARENIARGSPLSWWGNVRFEKSFTRDVADFLSAGGLIGVSAGLESATGNGLSAIHKGTDLESIVGACCAFKEAGILVHAYMIYGYWWETAEDLMNSMETLRQFYAHSLLDSSFWHKFVLTRHSRIYKEWKEGRVPGLRPVHGGGTLFCSNALHFAGEEKSEKYGAALERSLGCWMHGEHISRPVQKWFGFPVPKPTVASDFIETLIAKYEAKRDSSFAAPVPDGGPKKVWLGSEKIPLPGGKVGWFYMGELFEADKNAPETFFRGKGLCVLP